jgi:hypothetical protein
MAFTLNRRLAQLVDSNGQLNTGKIPNDYITGDHIADNVITSAMLHTSFTVSTSNLTAIDTDDVSEGTSNLYFTNARADARIAAATTDDLTEGSTNLYFTNARIDSHLSGGTGVTYSSGAISIGQDVGTTATPTFGNITTTGYIAGPATFTIDPAAVGDNTGTVVIAGNLQVDGTTTTINSTTVNVDDLNIQLATGAANAAAADGAGITVDGASATITYDGTTDKWDFNKFIEIGSGYGGTPNIESQLILNDSGNNYITIGSGASSEGGILFADSGDNDVGVISYNHSTNSLGFRTNGVSNRMIIDSSGDVGIGTTSPSARLHIQPANSDTLANAIFTRQNNAAGSDGNSFALRNDAANNFVEMNSGGTNNGGFKFYRGSFSNDPALTIIGSGATGGNVGIGTETPQRNLTVTGSADTPSDNTGILSVTDGTGVNTDAKMQFGITSNGHGYIHTVKPGTDIKSLLLAPAGGSGRVGIGMSSTPSTRLHVAGETYLDNNSTLSTASNRQLTLRDSDNTSMQMYFSIDDSVNDGIGAIQVTESGVTNDRPLLLQYHGGNVGIGTLNPPEKFTVDGGGAVIAGDINSTSGSSGLFLAYASNISFLKSATWGQTYRDLVTESSDFIVRTGAGAATEKLRVTQAGRVGIGTNNPSHGLTVSDALAGTSESRRITIQSTTHGVNAGYRFDTESADGTGRAGGLYYSPSNTAGASYIALSGDDTNTHLAVTAGGNVGIGKTNPENLLHIGNGQGTSPHVFVDGSFGSVTLADHSRMYFGDYNFGIGAGGWNTPSGETNNDDLYLWSYHGAGRDIRFARVYDGSTAVNSGSWTTSMIIKGENGRIGIGTEVPSHPLHLHGGNTHTNLVVSTNDGYKSEVRMMEDAAGTTHGGFIRYDGNGDYVQIGHYNSGTEMMGWSMDDQGNIAVGATNASGHFEVHGGRMGIVSTDSSWEQLRVCNTSTTGEAGIAIFNGANSGEFLSDTQPIFSNAFTLAINPYGCGSDTLAIGHGNLGDSIWHIDGSGNFGYGPNTENPVSYYEISKTRPNVNAPSDYELKLTLNTYGYVGSNYKLGMLQFLGGDTAGAQDNFYAALSARAANGANNQEDGALQFHVKTAGSSDTLAAEFNGDNNPSSQIAGSGSVRNGMLFRWQGIAIDRSWGNYPGIAVMNSSDYSTTASTQAEFRVHGTNGSSSSYPSNSGSDFSVNFRVDGSYISGSDRRRKTNITTINNALEKVNQLTGKRFQTVNRAGEVNEHQSKADNYKFGLIAQEVEDIIPEATKYYEDEDDGTEGWNSSYSIDYPSLTALLINAIKEQDVVIQDLKSRIETLEG